MAQDKTEEFGLCLDCGVNHAANAGGICNECLSETESDEESDTDSE